MEKEMAPGRVLGGKILNIYDTGLDKGCSGYVKYDDEGVRSEKLIL
jgi:TldD protein